MSRNIHWIELDASILKLNPREFLQASLQWNNKRDDEPWLSIIKPTSVDMEYFVISLSLNAYFKFTNKIVDDFKNTCLKILDKCNSTEITDMTEEEIMKGNAGELFEAQEGLFRLIVPKRLLDYSKTAISDIFQHNDQEIVKEHSWD